MKKPKILASYCRHWSRIGWIVELPKDHPDAFCGAVKWVFVFRKSKAISMVTPYNEVIFKSFIGRKLRHG